MEEMRKPTKEEKEEFDKIDKKLDNVKQDNRNKFKNEAKKAHIELRNKIFMKISDVEPNDARWFKDFCDRHVAGKQFLGIKVLRALADTEPLYNAILAMDQKILEHEERLIQLESLKPEETKLEIPKTQGSKRDKK